MEQNKMLIKKAWGVRFKEVENALNDKGYADNDLIIGDCVWLLYEDFEKVRIGDKLYFSPISLLTKKDLKDD